MAGPVEKSMKELANQAMEHQLECSHLLQEKNAPSFELKASFIRLLPKFHGWEHEDPHQHVKEFILICSSMTSSRIPKEAVLMKAFPMSLHGAARDWFIYQHYPFTGWQELQQRFLNKFFSTAKTANLRKEITTIEQFQEESLADYWERFNRFCTACPNHQISEALLLVYFYEGLLYNERFLVDAVAGGSLLDKTSTKARKLLSKIAGNDPDEVSGEQVMQVYFELSIPIHFSEVHIDVNAFNLLNTEPIEPAMKTVPVMHVHSDILDSAFQIDHVNIPNAVSDTYIDFNRMLYDRWADFDDAAANLKIGKIILNEPTQVSSELEALVVLPDLPMHLNAFDLLHFGSEKLITETDVVLYDHSKFLDSVLAIEPVDLNVVILDLTMNIDDCLDMNELLHDNILELNFDFADDAYVSIELDIETVQSENSIELGLDFDLTQFSKNFKCDCESASCSICIEINSVIQSNSKVLTDATNCELDLCAEFKKERNAENIKAVIWEEENAERLGKISSLVPRTQQLLVEGELLLLQQFA